MSVTAAKGFEAGGLGCGHQGRWCARPRDRHDRRPARGPGGRRVHPERGVRGAGAGQPRAPCGRARPRRSSSAPGTRTRRRGSRAAADARRMAALTGDGPRLRAGATCSSARPGSSATSCRWTRSSPASPSSPRRSTVREAAADAILTTDTVRKEAVATVGRHARGRRRHGQGRGDARSRDGDDARGRHHRRGDRARRRCRLRSPRRSTRTFNQLCVDACTSTNDTVLVLANGASGRRSATPTELAAFTDALTEVCGSLAEQMARDAEGATKFARVTVRGAASDDEARRAARTVAASQLVQCSLNGEDPYWGRVLSELGVSGAQFDQEQVEISYNGVVACRDGHRRAGDRRRARGDDEAPARDPHRVRPAAPAGPRRRCSSPTSRTPTSTRTGARREHRTVTDQRLATAHDKAAHPGRGAAVHPRVQRPDRRHQVRRPRDGGPGARGPLRAGRRADAPRRDEPGRRPRRRPADQRPHAPARQGAGVPRRPAGHRRRDRRHRPHGAGRQGQPRHRRLAEPARLVRGRPLR